MGRLLVVATIVFHAAGFTTQGLGEPPEVLDSGLRVEDVARSDYVDYVRQCADVLMEYGTDRYGPLRTPILVSILDVRTRECPPDPLPLDEAFRVTRRGRRAPAGANLYFDQRTLSAMIALSRITGDPRYSEFVDRYLKYYLQHLVDQQGFLWWGWHRHYDVFADTKTGHAGQPHEIHVQRIIWPELWRVNPTAVSAEIEAIWQWHVIDKSTGEINRHGDGQRGCDFAMSGGEILRAFAFYYSVTGDTEWLDRAKLVANYYWQRRDARTDLIANRPNAGRDRFDGGHFDTSISGLHCPALLEAHRLTNDALFRDHALAYLSAYLRYGHDSNTGRFWGSVKLDGTPVRGPRVTDGYAAYEPRGALDIWSPYVAGYEFPLYTAQAYAWAAQLTGDERCALGAQQWSDCLRDVWPPRHCESETWYHDYATQWAPLGTYAGYYGRLISFLLQRQRATNQAAYGTWARQVADEAVAKLYYRGLLRGHPGKPYYESIDGVGYLLIALLQLERDNKRVVDGDLLLENW
jgi:hypothetical protein